MLAASMDGANVLVREPGGKKRAHPAERPGKNDNSRQSACFYQNAMVGSVSFYKQVDIVHDSRENHYVIDINLTPAAGDGPTDPQLNEFLRHGIVTPSQRKPRPAAETALG